MKLKTNLPLVPDRQTLGTLLVSPRLDTSLPTTTFNGTGVKVNYNTLSQRWQTINNAIIFLDSNFKAKAGSVRAAWNTAAGTIPDARGCQCPYKVLDGQKLYRSYNLSKVLGGLPPDDTPPVTTAWEEYDVDFFHIHRDANPFNEFVVFQTVPTDGNGQVLWIDPYGNQLLVPTGNHGYVPPSFEWFFFALAPKHTIFKWCIAMLDGTPSTTGKSLLIEV